MFVTLERRGVMMILAIGAVIVSSEAVAQTASTVFRGRPTLKISEGGIERLPEMVGPQTAVNLECVISQMGDRY